MSHIGLEWTYRLALEPKRLWKRYMIDDLPVVWQLLKQKFNCYEVPETIRLFVERDKLIVPIGRLLQDAGLITEQQVRDTLSEQFYQRHLLFGELSAKKGLIKPRNCRLFC